MYFCIHKIENRILKSIVSRCTHIEPGLPSRFVLGAIIKVPLLIGRGDIDSCLSTWFWPITRDGLYLSGLKKQM